MSCDAAVELVHQDPSATYVRARSSADGHFRCNVAELLPLRLHYKVPWPLSMIVDDSMLVKYNQVLTFLLQVSVLFRVTWHKTVCALYLQQTVCATSCI